MAGEPRGVTRIRALDIAAPQWRALLAETIAVGAARGGRSALLGKARAEAAADEVLALIDRIAEDVEPILADLRQATAEANLEAQRSAGRRARLEHTLGIADVVAGEVEA